MEPIMGFALWMDGGIAKAQGTHEYRPMGVAIISDTDVFRQRDFDSKAQIPKRTERSFVGLFASLGDVNRFLVTHRSQANEKKFRLGSSRQLSTL
jgi:hypothetical protein